MKAEMSVRAVKKNFVPFDVTLTVESEQEGMFLLAMLNAPVGRAGFDAYQPFDTIDKALKAQGLDRDANPFFEKNREIYSLIAKEGV